MPKKTILKSSFFRFTCFICEGVAAIFECGLESLNFLRKWLLSSCSIMSTMPEL